jgi:hypothetical protein
MSDDDDCVPSLVPLAQDVNVHTQQENEVQRMDSSARRRRKKPVPVTLITGFLGVISTSKHPPHILPEEKHYYLRTDSIACYRHDDTKRVAILMLHLTGH